MTPKRSSSPGGLAIAADPTNPVPLVQVASALAESTRDTDLDREQRLAEAAKDAHAAIDNIDTGLLVPANADPARVEGAKRSILTMAYDTLGMVDMNKNDYASAEQNLQKAVDASKGNPEAVLFCDCPWLRTNSSNIRRRWTGQQSSAIFQGRNSGAEPGKAATGASAEVDQR